MFVEQISETPETRVAFSYEILIVVRRRVAVAAARPLRWTETPRGSVSTTPLNDRQLTYLVI